MAYGLPNGHPYVIALQVNAMRQTLGQPPLPLPPTPPGFTPDAPAASPQRLLAPVVSPHAVDRAAEAMLAHHNGLGGQPMVVDQAQREAQQQVMATAEAERHRRLAQAAVEAAVEAAGRPASSPASSPATDPVVADLLAQQRRIQDALAALSGQPPTTPPPAAA
ncbi:hypothetical protein [Kineococcus sp. SYSU DK006]|uniref:hypothetical protein n=1 Tax=Kineococcus sp. SYSU DK006 TaxID=3383127 RepID=UPI003D7CB5AF